MAELLELAHLVDQHRMADVKIGCRGVKSDFDNKWSPELELRLEPVLRQHLVGAANQFGNLFLNGCHLGIFPVIACASTAGSYDTACRGSKQSVLRP